MALTLICAYIPSLANSCLMVDGLCWVLVQLGAVLDTIDLKKPRIPVISNVDALPHSDPAIIKEILKKQVRFSNPTAAASASARVGRFPGCRPMEFPDGF